MQMRVLLCIIVPFLIFDQHMLVRVLLGLCSKREIIKLTNIHFYTIDLSLIIIKSR